MPPTKRRPTSPAPARAPAAAAKAKVEKKEIEWEFGGPIGAAGIVCSLPFVVLGLYFACNKDFCIKDGDTLFAAVDSISGSVGGATFWSWEAAVVVLGWFGLQALFYVTLPGPMVEGVKLRDGSRLRYPMNGHLAFWISLAIVCVGGSEFEGGALKALKPLPLSWLADHYLELATASIALSTFLALACYVASFRPGCMLADGGATGSAVYDFYIGRPLNPRLGPLDLKQFCELRPGLIGWALLNLGLAAKQYEESGAVSGSMVCINAFQLLYVWDALYYEQAILTTMDITTDGFGFMLAFGDLAWVPFTYSLQARILVSYDPGLPLWALLLLVGSNFVGYAVFRGSNSQKDAFRRDPADPAVAHLRYMQTQRGTKLLISGYWGLARKINYMGDWTMGLTWCLCCGGASPIAYFYATYFAVLLVHRATRDDHFCSVKYGADWKKYKEKVPYLFVPGLI